MKTIKKYDSQNKYKCKIMICIIKQNKIYEQQKYNKVNVKRNTWE